MYMKSNQIECTAHKHIKYSLCPNDKRKRKKNSFPIDNL